MGAEQKSSGERKANPYLLVLFAAAIYVVIAGFKLASPIIMSGVLILLIALALNPVISKLRRWSGGRKPATGLLIILFFAILFSTGWAFYQPVKRAASQFFSRLPQYLERIQKPLVKMEEEAVRTEAKVKSEIRQENGEPAPPPESPAAAREQAERRELGPGFLSSALGQVISGVTRSFRVVASSAAALVVIAVTVFAGVVFTLFNPTPVFANIFAVLPQRHHAKALRIGRRIVDFVPRWALATLLGMLVIGLLVFFAMWPLFGFHDALVLGLIAMVFEAVPYIGPLLSVVPAFLLSLGEGGWTPLWVIIAYTGVQLLENNVILPMIMAGQLKFHPVTVIFAVLVFGAIFGVLGVLVAVPLTAIIRIFYEELYHERFLPDTNKEDLDRLARTALGSGNSPGPKKTEAKEKSESDPAEKRAERRPDPETKPRSKRRHE